MTTFESNKVLLHHILDVTKPGFMLNMANWPIAIQSKGCSKIERNPWPEREGGKRGRLLNFLVLFNQVLPIKGSKSSLHKKSLSLSQSLSPASNDHPHHHHCYSNQLQWWPPLDLVTVQNTPTLLLIKNRGDVGKDIRHIFSQGVKEEE